MKKTLAIILLLTGIISIAKADEPYDYAARWNTWDVYTRTAYVIGVTEGISTAFFTTKGNLTKKPTPKEELLIMDILNFGSGIERKKIIEVMTDLYQDPANSYIETTKIFLYAQERIKGKDISRALENARRQEYELHRLEQKINK
jgi:hypothetical protein